MLKLRILFNLSIFLSIIIILFYIFSLIDHSKINNIRISPRIKLFQHETVYINEKVIKLDNDYNLWLIFTKVIDKSPLMYNFKQLILNLIDVSSVPLKFHLIVDDKSKGIAIREIHEIANKTSINIDYTFYNVKKFAEDIQDIVSVMTPYFSSRPGTYYSDALFYLSLGLYRVAPQNQTKAIMLDCDIYFKEDILLLFEQFESFEPHNLFGLAPELSPVYRHILYGYKQKHNTTFGEYYHDNKISNGIHPKGFQGYNSGVILLDLSAIRTSQEYKNVIKEESIRNMSQRYKFRGHLGDQDFFTLLGYDFPHLIRTLNCGFNRQLCTWWRDRGYKDIETVFPFYFKCNHKTVILHGNCNTKIPL